MEGSLIIYDRIADPGAFMKDYGKSIYLSGLFGCTSQAQGEVFAIQCAVERASPLSLKRKYHIIGGELSMRSDAMLADFNSLGGKHKIISRTPELASVELSIDGQTQVFSLSWEDAQKEPFPFGKENKVKKNWATPRSRMQMLWARIVSDGVRAMKPAVCAGSYTPEEIVDFENAPAKEREAVDPVELVKKANAAMSETEGEVVDGEFKVVEEPAKPAAESKPAATTQPTDATCTATQRDRIRELVGSLDMTAEQWAKVLAKRGVKEIRHLTSTQAIELIARLEEAVAKKPATPIPGASVYAPVNAETVAKIRTTLAELGQPAEIEKLKQHLHSQGKGKIAELSQRDAEALLNSLQAKNLSEFFARSLEAGPQQQPEKEDAKKKQ